MFKKIANKIAGAASAVALAISTTTTAFATSWAGGASAKQVDLVAGTKKLFTQVGLYGGSLYAIIAIFTLVLAIRNEDNEGRNKAILNLLAAVMLLSFGAVLAVFSL